MINCKVVFTGDSVYLLNKNIQSVSVGLDNPTEAIELAELANLELLVLDADLNDSGFTRDDLIDYENLRIITLEELADLIEKTDTIFRF